jgi:hypothetical protein
LYKNGPASLDRIAGNLGRSVQTIQTAVDHEWFAVRGGVASIAVCEEGHLETPRGDKPMSEQESGQVLRALFGSSRRPPVG